ncbi:cytochrome c biogenesis protein CcdA [Fodinicola feengrottensis]|uniref:cytochrome c biogenesis protein CcdA n=1 Tax=Fodinicola feengrottensis TaxID=435914 RepID=UPI0036F3D030
MGAFAEVAANGPLLAALGVAALAGLVSFFAPCMLPLLPGYLSYVTGLTGADLDSLNKTPVVHDAVAGPSRLPVRRMAQRRRLRAGGYGCVLLPGRCCSWPGSQQCSRS